jgi:hypothetical protein
MVAETGRISIRRPSTDSIQRYDAGDSFSEYCGAMVAETGRTSIRRPSNDSIQRCDERRRSVGDSFAQYNQEQVDLTRLAILALKQYLVDDVSDDESDEEHEIVSNGYVSDDNDTYVSEEDDLDYTALDPIVNIDDDDENEGSMNLANLVSLSETDDDCPTPCYEPHSSCTKPLQSSLANFSDSSYFDSPSKKNKKLCFGTITIREYAVTVGALSASSDFCPLQLCWEYGRDVRKNLPPCDNESSPLSPNSPMHCIDQSPKAPRSSPLRRLSLYERRQRIAAVQGIAEEQVELLQFDRVMSQIREALDEAQLERIENV